VRAASLARNSTMPPSSSIVTNACFGIGFSMISSTTCCSGSACARAWPAICASTSGVRT